MDGFAVVQNPEVAEPPWSEQMRRAAYVAEDLISCDELYILIGTYVYLITISRQHNLRDVGVAGSNPVTQTIDSIGISPRLPACGSRSNPRLPAQTSHFFGGSSVRIGAPRAPHLPAPRRSLEPGTKSFPTSFVALDSPDWPRIFSVGAARAEAHS